MVCPQERMYLAELLMASPVFNPHLISASIYMALKEMQSREKGDFTPSEGILFKQTLNMLTVFLYILLPQNSPGSRLRSLPDLLSQL